MQKLIFWNFLTSTSCGQIYELYFTNKVAIKLKENNTKMEHRHMHTQLN